jgi:Predicted molecular chaperone distantly related to HSP70-fold metalloproteases
MIVAGVMSGTSADGIDVAIARVLGRDLSLRFELLHHSQYAYSPTVRRSILGKMNASQASVADLARLNFVLGELYADAVRAAQKQSKIKHLDLVGCHGQTLYHQGRSAQFLGRPIACTWQTGEGAVLASRLGVPVVSDFRTADMAAGGKGAPLVPFFDFLAFRHRTRGRIAQNIGGIANLTAIPANAKPQQVVAFDTGPGNMVIDALAQELLGKRYDKNGSVAARGIPLERALERALEHRFFSEKPTKTAGREEFGREFTQAFVKWCGKSKAEDVLVTATALTARSIGNALRRFVLKKGHRFRDYVVSGGGVNNQTLMKMLAEEVLPLGLRLQRMEEYGVTSQAKEALAFAVLAYQTWKKRPSNLPAATGARRPVVLGKVSLP